MAHELVIPGCWQAVEDFQSEMNRMKAAGVLVDERLVLQVMRVLYDRAENNPDSVFGIDMAACMSAIREFERIVAERSE